MKNSKQLLVYGHGNEFSLKSMVIRSFKPTDLKLLTKPVAMTTNQ